MASVEKKKKADKDAKAAAKTAFNTAVSVPDGRPVFKLGGAKPKAAAPKAKPAGGARPETPGRYPKANPSLGIGEAVRSPSTKAATPAPKPKAKPAAAPPKPTMKPSKGPASGKMAYEAPKSNFKGNWVGAAPTDMQKRGGAKISRGGGLLGAVKRKLGK
jgi:hypothetical protein